MLAQPVGAPRLTRAHQFMNPGGSVKDRVALRSMSLVMQTFVAFLLILEYI